MIVTALFVCLVNGALGVAQGSATNPSNWFKDALVDLKTVLKNGDPSLNIPRVDPLLIDRNITWNKAAESFSFTGSFSGFSDYNVNSGDLNEALITVASLTFPQINLTGKYDLMATYGGILPLQGSGAVMFVNHKDALTRTTIYSMSIFRTSFKGLNVFVNATFKPGGGVIRLYDFSFSYDYDSSTMQLSGVLNQFHVDNTLSHILQDAVPNILQKYNVLIGDIVSRLVETKGTAYLETLNINRIIEIAKRLI